MSTTRNATGRSIHTPGSDHKMPKTIRRGLAALVAPALLLMGCSGGYSKDADGAEEALEDYFHELANGDDDACDMETKRYREESNEFWEEGIDCPDRVKQAQGFMDAFEVDLEDAEFDAEVDGDKATVQVSYDDGEEETYGLVYEDDRWLVDSEGEADASDGETELSEEEAQATADGWLASWCSVQTGMSRDEAIALMGEPTSELGIEDDADPQLHWSLGAYDFTVFLDTDDIVTSFGGNYDSLGESDLAQLPCVTEGDFGYERSEAAPEDTTTTEPPATEEPSPTTQIGEKVSVGPWDIKVTKVVKNANEILANPNFYNDKPRDQYVLVTYAATYTGTERTADVTFDLTWSFTSSTSKVFDSAYQTTPADAQEWPYEARAGGTVEQQVVFDIPADTINGGILTVEADDENFNTVYADFPIN
ncbi:nuclear transport factor 2 family protein [Nocardioides bizhenqiangii]|uniref:DUF4352 domain-containing protein n=1 Tax=Nocardioides bizhenqiangii TaxID=3095076 RepID=A0ABZ0ZT94_9ACTN|nr:hypothetical protein [Nocardioides sp. HM61]WQQ27285.1 hypothetical protein SHK19_03435 [Nocardioides sp. HM61]